MAVEGLGIPELTQDDIAWLNQQKSAYESGNQYQQSWWDRNAPDWLYGHPYRQAAVGALGAGLLASPTVRAVAVPVAAAGALGYGAYKYAPKAYEYAKEHPYRAAGIGAGALALTNPAVASVVAPAAAIGGLGYGAYKAAPWVAEQVSEHPWRSAGVGLGAAALLSPSVRQAILPAAAGAAVGYGVYKAAPWVWNNLIKPAGTALGDIFIKETDESEKARSVSADKKEGTSREPRKTKATEILEGYNELMNMNKGSSVVRAPGAISTEVVAQPGADLSRMLSYVVTGR